MSEAIETAVAIFRTANTAAAEKLRNKISGFVTDSINDLIAL